MPPKIIDACGEICPKPLILTKKALQASQASDTLMILVDNETAKDNILSFLCDNGEVGSVRKQGNNFEITVTKQSSTVVVAQPVAAKPVLKPAGQHVIVIKSDKMGQGSDELGAILLQAFINTIRETSPLPAKIVFYNGGIKLVVTGSPVLPALTELAAQGVEILACGACLDYFQKKHELQVGRVSNMFTILASLTAASHIIEP